MLLEANWPIPERLHPATSSTNHQNVISSPLVLRYKLKYDKIKSKLHVKYTNHKHS